MWAWQGRIRGDIGKDRPVAEWLETSLSVRGVLGLITGPVKSDIVANGSPIPVCCHVYGLFYSSDGRVVRASASKAVDLGLIPSQVKPMTVKLAFTASLLDAQH